MHLYEQVRLDDTSAWEGHSGEAAKVQIKDEGKSNTKKAKRIESKAVKFCENQSREEFRRKRGEFQIYQERTDIKGEDIVPVLRDPTQDNIKQDKWQH